MIEVWWIWELKEGNRLNRRVSEKLKCLVLKLITMNEIELKIETRLELGNSSCALLRLQDDFSKVSERNAWFRFFLASQEERSRSNQISRELRHFKGKIMSIFGNWSESKIDVDKEVGAENLSYRSLRDGSWTGKQCCSRRTRNSQIQGGRR